MKRIFFVVSLCLVFLLTPALSKVRTAKKETVQARLEALFELCKAGEFEKTAEFWVYTGPDKKRKWKDVLNPEDPDEAAEALEMCKRIAYLLVTYDKYEFGEFEVEVESEGAWHVLETIFTKEGEEPKKVYFCFLLIKGKLAIGDIDS